MSCTVTDDGPCRRTLTFEVERERLVEAVDKGLVEYAQNVDLKGFRKGKAPIALIRKSHGPAIEEDVRRKIMSEEFSAAIKEHSLQPVGDPEMNLEKLDAEGPGPFTFEFAIEISPDISPDIPEKIPVTVALADVVDEMVDGEVYRFREQSASLQDAEEGAGVAQDDILEGTVVYTVDGEALEPRTDRAVFTKHSLVDSIRIEDSAAAFMDKTKGDTVQFEVTLPDHFAPAEHAGKSATLAFTIDRHRLVILPEMDEEFLKKLNVKTEDEMRDRIRQELDQQRSRARDQMIDTEIEKVVLEGHEFDLPSRLLTKAIEHRVHEFAHRLMKERGVESEEGHQLAEEQREDISAATTRGLKLAFLLSRIAEDNDLKPSAEQTIDQIKGMAIQQQKDPEELVKEASEEGWISDVFEQLMHQNARTWLRQFAEVTETAPQPPTDD